jgi:hypothetical protein
VLVVAANRHKAISSEQALGTPFATLVGGDHHQSLKDEHDDS